MNDKVKFQYVQMILTPGDLDYMSHLLDIWSQIVEKKEAAIIRSFLDALNSAYVTNVRSEEELKSLIARNQNI
jgi:hypothetical protein